MTNIQALILGLVQGLCEFLPISSTGHLQIAQSWMGLEANTPEMMFFDTILHAATLVAVIGMLLPEILKIFGNLGKSVIRPKTLGASFRQGGGNRMLMALVVGTIPALVAAYFLRDFLENLLPGKWLGLGFLITAVVLCMGELVAPKVREMRSTEAKASDALMVGVAQALALLPGASRSGLTITAGRASGFTKVYAAKFSFLLSAVAILGGTLVQLPGVLKNGMGGIEMVPIIIGAAAAALSGMLAITFLVKLLKKGNLVWFAFYTAALGLMVFWEIIPA